MKIKSDMGTRERIVEAADRLLYEKGFEYTSFGDLAAAVQISRGNVTFHFKTRDEILEAVVDRRIEQTRAMLDQWETAGNSPGERILSFAQILIGNRAKILLYGCPVGSLCTELAKLGHPGLPRASKVFSLFRAWLSRQFSTLGCGTRSDSLAMHVLAWSQGVATLAQAFHDERFLRAEVRQFRDWLQAHLATAERGRKSPPRPARRPARTGQARMKPKLTTT